jgi:hypothetical protein
MTVTSRKDMVYGTETKGEKPEKSGTNRQAREQMPGPALRS